MAPRFDRLIAVRWAIVAPATIVLGFIFEWLRVPAGWILAAILCSAAMALITHEELPLNKHFFAFARGFVAVLAAIPLTVISGGELASYLLPGLFVSVFTVSVGLIGGVLMHRAQPKDVSTETGVLSMLPGGASMMPVLAQELGADFRYVSLSQYLRLLCVAMSLPVIVSFMTLPTGEGGAFGETSSRWWVIALILVIAFLGEHVGRFLRLPAATVFGPILLVIIVSFFLPADVTLTPPDAFATLAFLGIGWFCGGQLSMPALKAFAKQLPALFLFIGALMAVCAATALPLHWWLDITYFEAYLATSPGALETVLALASEGNASAAVVTVQLIRLVFVLIIAGYLSQIIGLAKRFRKH